MIRNPEIQFASADAIAAFQQERLREEIAYLYENSPYYRRMFDHCGARPGDIRTQEDLRRLPVTTKTDLQLHPQDFICVPRSRIIDYVTTSGTLGDPVTFALTEEDLARLAYNEAMSFTTAGCTGEDILQLMTTIDRRFMAGLAYFLGARKLRCGVIRVGNGIPELQWDTIRRIGPTGCIVVPSFLTKLVAYAEEHGIDYRRSSLRRAICIGEALRDTAFGNNTLGAKITELWPELELFSTYASTEMQTSITECGHHCGGHVPADLILVELLDEQNNPVAEGEEGEVVITTLGVRGMPLLRFRTGDICIGYTERCAWHDAAFVGHRPKGADDQVQGHDALSARAVRHTGEHSGREQLHHRGLHGQSGHRPDRAAHRQRAPRRSFRKGDKGHVPLESARRPGGGFRTRGVHCEKTDAPD